jgi:hypothetical protein
VGGRALVDEAGSHPGVVVEAHRLVAARDEVEGAEDHEAVAV